MTNWEQRLANATVPHEHSWTGGKVLSITPMPGEMSYYLKEWECQFCPAKCRGETLDWARKQTLLMPSDDDYDALRNGT